jgi:hypothetical protein
MDNISLDISDFRYGTIKRADARDIPIQAAIDSNNIDSDAPEGRLQGIPVAGSDLGVAVDAKRSAWILRSDGTYALVYVHGYTTNGISVLKDFYGTPTDSGLSKAFNAYSFVVHNQECHIGCGQSNVAQFIGYISYGQFGGAAPGWINENSALVSDADVSTVTAHVGSSTPFDVTRQRQYASSCVYDYTQESTLGTEVLVTPISTTDYITVRMTTSNLSTYFSKRITAVKLYEQDLDSAGLPLSVYRLVTQIDTVAAGSWAADGFGAMYVLYNDYGDTLGATYEQETGIADSITSNSISYYTLSCESNNYMFITGCTKTEVPDASHMVFRSQSYRYDMYNWSAVGEFIRLQNQPTAMVGFNNKVYIFDSNNMYRLDPSGMVIEDKAFGIGCLSQRSIIVTPYGMFWCDAKNAYWHDGTTLHPIGDTIRGTIPWHGFTADSPISATYFQDNTVFPIFCSAKNLILFVVPNTSGNVTNVWAWHISKQRWDAYTSFTACGNSTGGFTGKDGEVYIADTTHLYNVFGGATFRAMYWTSGDLAKEDINQVKKFYKFKNTSTAGSSTVTPNYSIDKGSNFRALTSTIQIKDTNGVWEKQNQIRLKVSLTTGTGYVDSLSLVYRKMEGER